MTVVRMPEVATGTGSAAIQSWTVAVGDPVRAGQPIMEIETEKAVVDHEVDVNGVFAAALLAERQSALVGAPIAVIAVGGQSIEQAFEEARADGARSPADGNAVRALQGESEEADPPAQSGPSSAVATSGDSSDVDNVAATNTDAAAAVGSGTQRRLFLSPLVRRLARERDIDLAGVVGSGPKGRIVRRDLDRLEASRSADAAATTTSQVSPSPARQVPVAPAHPVVEAPGLGFVEIPHTGMRRAIARRLSESKATVPHFYLSADCRMDALLDLRAELNEDESVKISVNDLVVKAVAWALRDVPEANATWGEDAIRQYERADVSVAVALPTGLMTPVVRGADQLSISELSAAIRDLSARAREGKLKQHEIEGGAFSVSNLGMHGVTEFAAIINPPQAGILAVGSAGRRPVVGDCGAIHAATTMRVTLSADHRVLDGALAASWLSAFTKRIENPLSILL